MVLSLVLCTGLIVGRASADQPHMHAALEHLRAARASLDKATPDKGGHRARALTLVNDAIAEVEAGMSYDRKH
jgi:hypothetical protein